MVAVSLFGAAVIVGLLCACCEGFRELGPGRTLSTYIRREQPKSPLLPGKNLTLSDLLTQWKTCGIRTMAQPRLFPLCSDSVKIRAAAVPR
jgi:hypothetical protein